MYIVFVVVAAVTVFVVMAVAVGRLDGLERTLPDRDGPYLPDDQVEPADLDHLSFAVVFRGYRMDQVDAVVERLARELSGRDEKIARLEKVVHGTVTPSPSSSELPTRPRPDPRPIENDRPS